MSHDERVEQIRERLAAATPGPWTIAASDYKLVFAGSDPWALADAKFVAGAEEVADAELIAGAPDDLAYLQDALAAVREEPTENEGVMKALRRHREEAEESLAAAREENRQLVTLCADYSGERGLSPDEIRSEFAAAREELERWRTRAEGAASLYETAVSERDAARKRETGLREALEGMAELFKTQRAVCLVPEDWDGRDDPLDRVASAEAALAGEGGDGD